MKKMNKKGFTIVELVIVIAVIAILAAVMIPTFSGIIDKANASKVLQNAKNAYTQVLLANDGVLDEASYSQDNYTFAVTDGVLTGVTFEGYTITVTSGAITGCTKNS